MARVELVRGARAPGVAVPQGMAGGDREPGAGAPELPAVRPAPQARAQAGRDHGGPEAHRVPPAVLPMPRGGPPLRGTVRDGPDASVGSAARGVQSLPSREVRQREGLEGRWAAAVPPAPVVWVGLRRRPGALDGRAQPADRVAAMVPRCVSPIPVGRRAPGVAWLAEGRDVWDRSRREASAAPRRHGGGPRPRARWLPPGRRSPHLCGSTRGRSVMRRRRQ